MSDPSPARPPRTSDPILWLSIAALVVMGMALAFLALRVAVDARDSDFSSPMDRPRSTSATSVALSLAPLAPLAKVCATPICVEFSRYGMRRLASAPGHRVPRFADEFLACDASDEQEIKRVGWRTTG